LLLPPQERLNLMTNSADTRQMPSESGI
jgi:transcriptional regulator